MSEPSPVPPEFDAKWAHWFHERDIPVLHATREPELPFPEGRRIWETYYKEIQAWLNEHAGPGNWAWEHYWIGMNDPDLAFAFKMRFL